ncbi:hypothetical protein FOFC_13368 [Fusarium oxysporum]|nr:hypothetical protein FOFC_13368 [Fusarium oxysporum]
MGDPKKIKIKLRGGDIEAAHDGSIFNARGPASICSHMVPSRLDAVTGPVTTGRTQGEDCLHLTVTAPLEALTDGRKRPVMVFLHGGAYVFGGGDLDAYSPVGLAERDLVVINVTLFRESAGADSIFCLMIAEGTQNLFHRAIFQSAPLGVRLMDREPMIQRLSELVYKRLTSSQAPRTSEELLSLQTELTIAAKSYPSGAMAFGPSLGHAPLPLLSQVPHRIESPIRTYE